MKEQEPGCLGCVVFVVLWFSVGVLLAVALNAAYEISDRLDRAEKRIDALESAR